MALEIKITEKKSNVYLVALKGSIDVETYQELEEKLKRMINDQTKAVILDLGGVDYISSIGIKVVLWAKKALQAQNANFAMTNLQPQIKKVFDVMKILPIIDIFDDMPEADKYIDQVIKEEMNKKT
ncbi:MAG: STAS domain-containing protein [Candidatus Omnitrophica bacterium]|nr:STAS domain-containing protein [Candidatus Omnitrophota bacterium]